MWQKALSTQQFNLQQLFLEELGLEKLPEPVVQLRKLRVLGLASNKLEDIPAGPYLENLSVLDLHSNLMRSIPPALTACASLYELHVELNIFLYPSEGCLCEQPNRCVWSVVLCFLHSLYLIDTQWGTQVCY